MYPDARVVLLIVYRIVSVLIFSLIQAFAMCIVGFRSLLVAFGLDKQWAVDLIFVAGLLDLLTEQTIVLKAAGLTSSVVMILWAMNLYRLVR